MTWLGFSLQALERQQAVVIASVSHCPPPLQLPIGPIWACTSDEAAGYSLPGRPQIQLQQAARQLLSQTKQSLQLSIPLNPWAGDNEQKHKLNLHLRKLAHSDLSMLMLLDGKLRIGQGCQLDLEHLFISDTERHAAPLTPQAQKMQAEVASFAPTETHIAVFGAGALAHQIVKLLSDGPFSLHWEASASERVLEEQAANILMREPTAHTVADLPENTHCLVMTHDHALDFKLCVELAAQRSVRSVGVVGSRHKCKALGQHLAELSLQPSQLAKVRCPLGGRQTLSLNMAALDIAHEVSDIASDAKIL